MELLVVIHSGVAEPEKVPELVADIKKLGQPLISSLLHTIQEVFLIESLARNLNHVAMEGIWVLDKGGVWHRIEALVQLAKQVVFLVAKIPVRPIVPGLLFEIDRRGISPRQLQ